MADDDPLPDTSELRELASVIRTDGKFRAYGSCLADTNYSHITEDV